MNRSEWQRLCNQCLSVIVMTFTAGVGFVMFLIPVVLLGLILKTILGE